MEKVKKLGLTNYLDVEDLYHIYVATDRFLHDYIVIKSQSVFSQYLVLELMKVLGPRRPLPLIVCFHIKTYDGWPSKLKCMTTIKTTLR